MKLARTLIMFPVAALIAGCAASEATPKSTSAIRAYLLDPSAGPSPLPRMSIDRFADHDPLHAQSTIYQVQRCDQRGQCTGGVAQPQISIRITDNSPTSVSFEAKVDYSVAAKQTSGLASGASYSNVTIEVPHAQPMHEVFVKRATLNLGEERRLDLPYGESLTFCARRVQGSLRESREPCAPPLTAEQIQTIPNF